MRINKEQRNRFMSIIYDLMIKHEFKSEMEFCLKNKMSHNVIQEIKAGRTGISRNVENILTRYGASLKYIYTGEGKKFIKPVSEMNADEKLTLIIDLLQQILKK